MTTDFSINDNEFSRFRQLLYQIAGINLSNAKKMLLVGRLSRRLRHYQLHSFEDYFRLVTDPSHSEELQTMVDLLTTNETYFFREPAHFDFLRHTLADITDQGRAVEVWSAASSTGEEAYSIAMTLADCLREKPWSVLGTDISTQVLQRARLGHYPLARNHGIPPAFLRQYCLKGIREQEGTFLIERKLRQRVQFQHMNLNSPQPLRVGNFDYIFLRNVMIYFDTETKQRVIQNLLPNLRSGGYLIIGHSETLHGITDAVKSVRPTIYRKP